MTYTDLRQNLAYYMDQAVSSRAPIVVTRQAGRGNVVMISEEEFSGWQETAHLLSSPRKAERLLRGIRRFEAGEGRVADISDSTPFPKRLTSKPECDAQRGLVAW